MFGRTKQQKLEERRAEVLSLIRAEQWLFEKMLQRAQIAGDPPTCPALLNVPERLREFERMASQAPSINELEDIENVAEGQARFRVYVCPGEEIWDEANSAIDDMETWNVPKPATAALRSSLGQRVQYRGDDLVAARTLLRIVREKSDFWSKYTVEYEEAMRRFARWWLFCPALVLILLDILVTLRFPHVFPLALSILFAGTAGSCVSVITKLPLLEVKPVGELDSYERRILSRVGVGVIASLVGCGLLGWGVLPVSIQGQTFADVLNACSTSSCTGPHALILLAVPMLFGFSERALTSFEDNIFGTPRLERGRLAPSTKNAK